MKACVFYRGPSRLDGAPVVAIATAGSTNRKTGSMVQTWILRASVDPVRAVQTGRDASVCGDCVHRGVGGVRTCYVNVGQAPLSVWRAWRRGVYPRADLVDLVRANPDLPVRCGSYGDPAAVPWPVWRDARDARSWTGYTHQWRRPDVQPLRTMLMASCDSLSDMADAARMGWRTFRVQALHELDKQVPVREVTCPSVTHGTQCARCSLCRGSSIGAPSIRIPVHGTTARFFGVTP